MKLVLSCLIAFILNSITNATIKNEQDLFSYHIEYENSNDDKNISVTEIGAMIITYVEKKDYCAGNTLSITYTLSGTFKPGNILTAQLSNATGSFLAPLTLDSLCSTTSGIFNVTVPGNISYGTGYRIRLISSSPYIMSCSNGSSITIHSMPELSIYASDTIVCEGASVTLTGNGANNYTWTNGISNGTGFIPSATSTYTLTGTSINGCTNTATKTITVNPLPDNSISINGATIFCPNDSVVLTASENSYACSYLWSNGAITRSLAAYTTGNYKVSIKNIYGCFSTSLPVTVTISSLKEDFNNDGIVNHIDLSMITAKFDSTCSCQEDINNDGEVTQSDLSNMLSKLGEVCK